MEGTCQVCPVIPRSFLRKDTITPYKRCGRCAYCMDFIIFVNKFNPFAQMEYFVLSPVEYQVEDLPNELRYLKIPQSWYSNIESKFTWEFWLHKMYIFHSCSIRCFSYPRSAWRQTWVKASDDIHNYHESYTATKTVTSDLIRGWFF